MLDNSIEVNPDAAAPYPTQVDYDAAIARILEAAHAYYDTETLLMDDATYDGLVACVIATEADHPEWRQVDVLAVAAGVSAGGDVTHSAAMLSLDKAHTLDAVTAFLARFAKLVGDDNPELTVEVKLDGVALAARYDGGKLVQVITRGDGHTGEDVTTQIATGAVVGMPLTVSYLEPFEVRGECILTEEQFAQANRLRVDVDNKAPFVNRRNGVAGSVRAKDRGYNLAMTFGAYSLHGDMPDGVDTGTFVEQMSWLSSQGFNPAMFMAGPKAVVRGATEVAEAIAAIGAVRSSLVFEIDGAVVKANRPSDREDAGSTGAFPRWAIAFKYPAEQRTTTVLAISIEPGRTGVLVPRADLEPVWVGGTTVTSATLHNPGEAIRLGVRVGSVVSIIRAGDVIPRIEGVLSNPEGTVAWDPPTVCPRCGSHIDKDQKRWRCTRGRACGAVELLTYATGREQLDLEGLGDTLAKRLVAENMVVDLAGLFHLTADQLAGMDRMGEVSANKLIAQIEASKTAPLSRWITALGLRMTGRRMSRRLATKFGTLEAFRAATLEELSSVEGVGDVRAASILEELAELSEHIDELVAAGVRPEPEVAVIGATDSPLSGKLVLISGTVEGLGRTEANLAAEALGAKVASSVSKKLDWLIAGPNAGASKLTKAAELGIPIMDASEFAAMVAAAS